VQDRRSRPTGGDPELGRFVNTRPTRKTPLSVQSAHTVWFISFHLIGRSDPVHAGRSICRYVTKATSFRYLNLTVYFLTILEARDCVIISRTKPIANALRDYIIQV
jgi:hypothetical protein